MKIKAVVFDVGGVLHSSENKYVWDDIKSTLGLTDEQFKQSYFPLIELLGSGKITEAEFWTRFLASTRSRATLPYESLLEREFRGRFKSHEETLEIVKDLKDSGIKLAVLSNTIEPHARVSREKGVFDLFPIVILSHEVHMRKPKPEIYKHVLAQLGVEPDATIMIDDLEENIAGAKAVGMQGTLFKDAAQLRKDLTGLGLLQG